MVMKMPISTVRAIVKRFETTGALMNLPERGCKYRIFAPMDSEQDDGWRFISKSPIKSTIRSHLYANNLFGRHAKGKAFFFHLDTDISTRYYCGQMRQK